MDKKMIIGLSGLAGSGKDTCADFLVEEFDFVKISLADHLKRICKDVFDFSNDQLWGPSNCRNQPDKRYKRENDHLTARYALQALGMCGRDCYNDIWIESTIRITKLILKNPKITYDPKIGIKENLGKPCKGVVIPDCRFLNEINAIKKENGLLYRIVRTNSGLKGSAGNHVSEKEMYTISDEEFDDVIMNDGSLKDLRNEIVRSVNGFRR